MPYKRIIVNLPAMIHLFICSLLLRSIILLLSDVHPCDTKHIARPDCQRLSRFPSQAACPVLMVRMASGLITFPIVGSTSLRSEASRLHRRRFRSSSIAHCPIVTFPPRPLSCLISAHFAAIGIRRAPFCLCGFRECGLRTRAGGSRHRWVRPCLDSSGLLLIPMYGGNS